MFSCAGLDKGFSCIMVLGDVHRVPERFLNPARPRRDLT